MVVVVVAVDIIIILMMISTKATNLQDISNGGYKKRQYNHYIVL